MKGNVQFKKPQTKTTHKDKNAKYDSYHTEQAGEMDT